MNRVYLPVSPPCGGYGHELELCHEYHYAGRWQQHRRQQTCRIPVTGISDDAVGRERCRIPACRTLLPMLVQAILPGSPCVVDPAQPMTFRSRIGLCRLFYEGGCLACQCFPADLTILAFRFPSPCMHILSSVPAKTVTHPPGPRYLVISDLPYPTLPYLR